MHPTNEYELSKIWLASPVLDAEALLKCKSGESAAAPAAEAATRDLSERHWEVDHNQKWLFWSKMKVGYMTHLLC